ncbi:conserved hypothetical protein [Exiguobacterium sp. 8H]|uniref:hypothetical protein n=1 Tax=unclassified Exiguobacterium TaxID=2644629 RepID=UPI0012F11E1A|nr:MULTISPECIES: hypothetical protein [unclassified Exiguobacterium]VXB73926.1 conserved hypothetical protein [Exiguobacterium sp. 8A]VXB74775.1 conserved hypothetical protein [Exiguobacterium sp. 8H]
MFWKKMITFLSVISLSILMGCGQQERELVVGNYTDEQTIVYDENRVTDEEKIKDFKTMIETSSITNERPEGLPQYVVTINNPAESTMELMVNFWVSDNNKFIFSKGIESREYFKVDEEHIKDVNELLE